MTFVTLNFEFYHVSKNNHNHKKQNLFKHLLNNKLDKQKNGHAIELSQLNLIYKKELM